MKSVINVMWSGGPAYASVHKVHLQILAQATPGTLIKTWLLQDKATACLGVLGEVKAWHLASRFLKGRGVWMMSRPLRNRLFYNALLKHQARLVLLDGLGVARALLPALRDLPQVRVVVVFHGSTRLDRKDVNLFRQFAPDQLTLCAVSQTLASSIEATMGLAVVPLRCMLDPQAFKQQLLSREQARQVLGTDALHQQVFGAIGRLVESKGFDTLIRAFAQSLQTRPDQLLLIIGEGPARSALEATISALGLQDKVLLPGHMANVASLYRAFDWVVIPSQAEGLGLVVQESVIAGVPVLASNLTVFHEQLGDAGYYIPVDDVAAWAKAIDMTASLVPEEVALSQYAALDPQSAWQRFRLACADELSVVQ